MNDGLGCELIFPKAFLYLFATETQITFGFNRSVKRAYKVLG